MLHAAFQMLGCHIWARRERESGSDECAKGEAVGIKAVETCHYRSTFYSLNPRSVTLVSEVGFPLQIWPMKTGKSF